MDVAAEAATLALQGVLAAVAAILYAAHVYEYAVALGDGAALGAAVVLAVVAAHEVAEPGQKPCSCLPIKPVERLTIRRRLKQIFSSA